MNSSDLSYSHSLCSRTLELESFNDATGRLNVDGYGGEGPIDIILAIRNKPQQKFHYFSLPERTVAKMVLGKQPKVRL